MQQYVLIALVFIKVFMWIGDISATYTHETIKTQSLRKVEDSRKFEEISILLKYSIFLNVSQFFLNESQSKNFPVIEIKTAPRVNLDSIFVKVMDPFVDPAHGCSPHGQSCL